MIKKNYLVTVMIVLLTFPESQVYSQGDESKKILWTADWSPVEKYIAVGGNLDTLKIYFSKNFEQFKPYFIGSTITCVKWHPFKNVLAIATQLPGKRVCILDLETDKIIELAGISKEGARGIDWNYTGEYLAVADNDGLTSIFNIQGKIIRKIEQENTKSITSIDWHPSKNIFITVGDKIRIYEFDGTLINTIIHRREDVLLLSVAWHKSGDFFVTGDYGDTQNSYQPLLQFWSNNGDLIKSVILSKGEYRNLSWNTKGNRLASASDALRIWDKKGNLISVGISEDYLWGVSWNRKGSRIVTSSAAQRIDIWDNEARRKLTIAQ